MTAILVLAKNGWFASVTQLQVPASVTCARQALRWQGRRENIQATESVTIKRGVSRKNTERVDTC